jgi:CysZ protein
MHQPINAAAKALDNLTYPPILRIALLCCGLSLLAMILFVTTITSLAAMVVIEQAWLDWALAIFSGAGAMALAWFLFPAMIPIIAGLFEDKILSAIDAKDYPHTPVPQPQPFLPNLWQDIRFAGKIILLNLLCLPFYLIPVLNVPIYYTLNGYLLGSEFFAIAAGRHLGKKQAHALRKQHSTKIWLGGLIIAFAATLPILNLLMPILAMALMAHLYHGLPEQDGHKK